MANKERYLSGKQKLTPFSGLSTDRHVFLSPQEAEPNLGYPGERALPVKDYYYNLVTFENGGQYDRYWQVPPAGIVTGISVFDEGSIVGTGNSINKLNFVGNIVNVTANNFGTISTITISPPGNDNEIIFNNDGSFATSPYLLFDNVTGVMTVGQYFHIGIGGTIIKTTAQGYVGVNTNNPTQELHVQGDVRVSGTIYDSTNDPGNPGEVLIKTISGIEWQSQNAVVSGAGGTIGQIQFHGTAGLVDGATNFWFDYTNNRVGLGSTTPRFIFDVVGDSGFAGPVTIKELLVTGVSTFVGVSTFTRIGIGTTVARNALEVVGNVNVSGVVTAALFDGKVSKKAITEQTLVTSADGTQDLLLLYSKSLDDVRKISIFDASFQGVQGIQGAQGYQGVQGSQGRQGTGGSQGFQGIIGPQGIQGIGGGPGSQGLQGIQGYQGVQGTQGNQGNQGFQGNQGLQGFQGNQGFQGFQGTDGNPGGAGSQGFQGTQGRQGIQGEQGIQGRQGIQGIQGFQGFQGIQGYQGIQGQIGDQGVQGIQGYQGLQGTGGATGGTGGQGLQGFQGNFGPQGPQGNQGIQGEQGLQGIQGFQGFQGIQGFQGRQGIQGNNGDQGTQGLQGEQGIQGRQGVQGDNGQGTQGYQGVQGRQGNQGIKGDLGSQGIQGYQGIQGEQGIQGISGTGNQGVQGNLGPQGVQGRQGLQGIDGSGNQGNQGLQGDQGIQGSGGGSGVVAAGTVVYFAANAAPSGYLECNGAAVSRLAYNVLFTAIGTVWGSGNGSSTFNVPDLRGEFIRGWSNGSVVDSGRPFAGFQDHQYQTHTHNIPTYSNTGSNAIPRTGNLSTGVLQNIEGGSPNTTNGGNNGSETRPRNYALLPCIKT